MKRAYSYVIVLGLLFLFFIQLAGTLVESIYILDLMHTSLDEKALGVLFFFAAALLLPFRKKFPTGLVWGLAAFLCLSRGLVPFLPTEIRMLASGLGTACALILLPALAAAREKGEAAPQPGWAWPAALALAVSLSALLRTLNYGIDYSLAAAGGWVGFALGAVFLWQLARLERPVQPEAPGDRPRLALPLLGTFLVLALMYFAFSAPAVIARWTGGSYPLIVSAVAVLSAGWAWLALHRPGSLARVPRRVLLFLNLAFTLSLTGTLLAQRVGFPEAPGISTTVPGEIHWVSAGLLGLALLLFPVLFLNLRVFASRIGPRAASPADWAPGLLLGCLALVLLVFINIFTNVWGYIDPVSTPFRDQYWLPFFLAAAGAGVLAVLLHPGREDAGQPALKISWGWTALLAVIAVGCAAATLRAAPAPAAPANPGSLMVMTYNIQAGNDNAAELAYERQLALILQVSPDILALQESDTARISLNNNDIVRYFASSLGYYSYYGPTTVTGTFGTAILSKYPLQNPAVLFAYSDSDEIGTTVAEIEVAGRRFTIYNVHPDGSQKVMQSWADTLLAHMRGKPNVIALGDYNSRKTDPAYQKIAALYTNAWTSVYPSEISPEGTNMSGRNRIDHIFLSAGLKAQNPEYLLPPASFTDHPVHWAEIFWEK